MSDEKKYNYKPLLGKVVITGRIKCLTGLHIGMPNEAKEIGGIDSPVMRDPFTDLPYIPGSSLKGKLRSLVERSRNKTFKRNIGGNNKVYIHVCNDAEQAVGCEVCRLFGSTGNGSKDRNFPARLMVRDAALANEKAMQDETGLFITEVKFENSLDRVTAAANPRQLERVPAEAEFKVEFVYNVDGEPEYKKEESGNKNSAKPHMVKEDLETLFFSLTLLEQDSLGGCGSRGYGRVEFVRDSFKVHAYKIGYFRAKHEDKENFYHEESVTSLDDCSAKADELASWFGNNNTPNKTK